jgi:hypothetical protein
VLLPALVACSQEATPADPKLWTLFDVQALYAGGAVATHGLAPNDGLPGGIPLGQVLNGSTLVATHAWTEMGDVSYVTTEVWSGFDRVWMQPAYVPITSWQAGVPQPLLDAAGLQHPIFSVGPHSGFYSPFWQIVYAQVPAGTSPGALTSARQILDGGYPLTPSEGRTMPLAPAGIMGGGNPGTGWLDGAAISYLDFGTATFTWDAQNVVQELPLYVFTLMGADGQPHALPEVPNVLGTAPPSSDLTVQPTAAPMIGGNLQQPRYAAYWRIYTVVIPPFASIFAPTNSPVSAALNADLARIRGTAAPQYSTDITQSNLANLATYVGQVAVNPIDPATGVPACFGSSETLNACTWVTSQAALEQDLDLSTGGPTGITVTAPVIEAYGSPVVPL